MAVLEVEVHSISVLVTSSHVHEPAKSVGPHVTVAADARSTRFKHETSSKQIQAPATRLEECILDLATVLGLLLVVVVVGKGVTMVVVGCDIVGE